MVQNFILCLATFLVIQSSLIEDWNTFVDPGGEFEVMFPDTITTNVTRSETPIGELEYYSLTSKEMSDSASITYVVSYCDYPEGIFHADSLELLSMFFEETIKESALAAEGEVLYADRIVDRKFDGYVWKIVSDTHKSHIKNMALMKGDRYYCLQVITPPSLSIKNNGDGFFKSFKLIEK